MKALVFGTRPDRVVTRPILSGVVGSNAFAMEEFDGVRQHAIEHSLGFVRQGRIDLTEMVIHQVPLEDWWGAPGALARPERSGVLKVAFAPNGS